MTIGVLTFDPQFPFVVATICGEKSKVETTIFGRVSQICTTAQNCLEPATVVVLSRHATLREAERASKPGQKRPPRRVLLDVTTGAEYRSVNDAARDCDLNRLTIYAHLRGDPRYPHPTGHKFVWAAAMSDTGADVDLALPPK